jgi:hypothetical protein
MRETGRTTRLFHAIVGMGLGAAAAGCGGQTTVRSVALVDAADDAVSTADAPDDVGSGAILEARDATQQLDTDAGVDAQDAGGDHWVPLPPVIA